MASKMFRRPWTVDVPTETPERQRRSREKLSEELERARQDFGVRTTTRDIMRAARRQERQAGPVRTALDMQRDVFGGREPRELGEERERRRRDLERVRPLAGLDEEQRARLRMLAPELQRERLAPAEFIWATRPEQREGLAAAVRFERETKRPGGTLAQAGRIMERLGQLRAGSAPVLGPIDIAYSELGRYAGKGARAAGAPDPVVTGVEVGAPIAAGVATGRLPTGTGPVATALRGGLATVGADVPATGARRAAGAVEDIAEAAAPARPRPGEARPSPGPEPVVRPVTPKERLSNAEQQVVEVDLADVHARPDLFQTRDVSVAGGDVGERRVQELVESFDPNRFRPPRLLRDPDGGYIIRDGHHRTAAARKAGMTKIPAIVIEGDLNDPNFLSRMRLEAVASNFSRAEMNIREQSRSLATLRQSFDLDEAAAQLRMRPSQAQDLEDMSRLGDPVMDRLVQEPALTPIAAEIGKGMRVYNIDADNARALFGRFSQPDQQGRTMTRTALAQTIKRFGPQLAKVEQGGLAGFDALGDTRGGILGLIDDVARSRATLESERRALRAAVKGAGELGKRTGRARSAQALVAAGEKEIRAVEARIKALERDLTTQLRTGVPSGRVSTATPAETISESMGPGRTQAPVSASQRSESTVPSSTTARTTMPPGSRVGASQTVTPSVMGERPTGAVTFGEERYRPEFGSQRAEFRGEEGLQPGMFGAEEIEVGPGGRQPRLEETARPRNPPADRPLPNANDEVATDPDLAAVAERHGWPSSVGGGEALTGARMAERQAQRAGQLPAETLAPGKVGREAWRKWQGHLNLRWSEVADARNDLYRLAEEAGFGIQRGAGFEKQTDQVIGLMEGLWNRAPVDTFPQQQRAFVQALYDRLDQLEARLVAADPSFERRLLPDYFPHLFKTNTKGQAVRGARAGRRPLGAQPGFMRERRLTGSLADTLEEHPNLDLFNWDPVDFVARHQIAAEQHIANVEVLKRLRAAGLVKRRSNAPGDWVQPNMPAFKPKAFLTETIEGEAAVGHSNPLVVPPELGKVLDDWYGVSAFDTNTALNTLKRGAVTGKMIKVLGGLFQELDFMWRTIGAATGYQDVRALKGVPRAWGRMLIPGFEARALKADLQNPIRRGLLDEGLSAGVDPGITERALSDLGEDLLDLPGAKQLIDVVGGEGYGRFHREMLLNAGETVYKDLRRQGLSHQDALVRAAERTNEFFSSIPAWQSVFRSPTTRDIMRTVGAFGPGELEGWFRIPYRAVTTKEGARFYGGILVATAAAAELLNLLFTGKPLGPDQVMPFAVDKRQLEEFRQRGPSALARFDVPFVDYNTTFLRPELPWRGPGGRKLYLDLLGQADTPFRWTFDPIFAAQSRLAQPTATAATVVRLGAGGDPVFGERPRNWQEWLQLGVSQLGPIPAGGFGEEVSRIGFGGGGLQAGGFNVSAEPKWEVIGRRFEELYGRPFNFEQDRVIVETDPRFEDIAEPSETQQAVARTTAAEETSGLPIAQAVLSGSEEAGEAFKDWRADFLSFRAGAVAQAYQGSDFLAPTSPAGRAMEELQTLSPDDYRDPETFEVQWDEYERARDALLAQLPPEVGQALERRTRFQNPQLVAAEREYKAAQRVRDQLDAIPRYRNIPVEIDEAVRDFDRQVRTEQDRILEEEGRDLQPKQVAGRLRRELDIDQEIYTTWLQLQSTKTENALRNREYEAFLVANADTLRPWYPSLYRSDRIIRQLRASRAEEQSSRTRSAVPTR